jgi:hypothetical protein
VITISALATELDFRKWSATFGQIADSMSASKNTRYRLRPLPDPSSGSRNWLILGGVIGVMLLFCGGWFYFSQARGPSTLDTDVAPHARIAAPA